VPRPRPVFGHGARVPLDGLELFGCFHVSQRNTFTGKLTPEMLRDVLGTAAEVAGLRGRTGNNEATRAPYDG
jgi:uracil-DNA glycosylase